MPTEEQYQEAKRYQREHPEEFAAAEPSQAVLDAVAVINEWEAEQNRERGEEPPPPAGVDEEAPPQ